MASFLQALTNPKVLGQVGRYVGFAFLVGGGLMTGCNHLEKRRYESLSNDASSVNGVSPDTAANEELVEPLLNLKVLANGAAPRRAYRALIQAVNGLTAGSNFLWEASYDPDAQVPADCQAVMCRHHKAVVTKLEALIKAARVPTGTYDPEWVKAHDNPMDFWRVTGGIALPLNVRWRGFCEALPPGLGCLKPLPASRSRRSRCRRFCQPPHIYHPSKLCKIDPQNTLHLLYALPLFGL